MEIPILAKLLISLLGIILVNRVSKNLSFSLLCGALTFSLWSGQGIPEILHISYERTIDAENLTLLAIVGLVIILSEQMSRTGMIQGMVENVRSRISTKTSMALLPAIIGLLPMPGGALFSAPVLDSFDKTQGVTQERKTRINYWFRHVWEYGWPLYPAVILAADISGISLGSFMVLSIVPIMTSILLGYMFLLRPIPSEHHVKDASRPFSFKPFFPIAGVIAGYFFISVFLPAAARENRYLPMLIALIVSAAALQLTSPLPAADWKEVLRSKKLLGSILIVYMVRIYGAFIEADLNGIPIAEIMTSEMASLGIARLPLIMLIPFFAGLTMGVSVGFVGSALPVVIAMLGVEPALGTLLGNTILAYICGFMGTILSPLHVCLIVTCGYFRTSLGKTLSLLAPLAAAMAAAGLLYRSILLFFFPGT